MAKKSSVNMDTICYVGQFLLIIGIVLIGIERTKKEGFGSLVR